jgi:hypothetical protein
MRLVHLVVILSLLLLGGAGCSSGDDGAADGSDTGFSDLADTQQETEVGADLNQPETPLVPDDVPEDVTTDLPELIDAVDAVQDSFVDAAEDTPDVLADLPPIEDGADIEDSSPPEEPAPALNEIGCYGDEFIELVNSAQEAPADLSGHILSDGEGPAHNYVLPAGTVVPPQGRLVIVEKSDDAVGFPFGIQCGGDTVALLDPDGEVVDSIELPLIMKGNSCSRLPDVSGPWEESLPTPGEVNQPKPDLEGILFDPNQVISMDLELPEASVAALGAQPSEYVIGMFSMTSGSFQQAPMPIGVRIKGGSGSLQTLDGKPALKLKFNFSEPALRLLGLKKLTLNNMVQDPSMIHEVLSFQLFRAFSLPCPRTGYAALTVNGEPYGVYLVLEAYDDVSLSMYFATVKHLYEGDSGVDVIPSHVSLFDIDEGSTSNTTDLSMFAIVASGTAEENWVAAIQDVADLNRLLKMWAVEHHIGHSYGYSITPNNYYLHSSSAKFFTMLPSGTDEAFVDDVDYHEGTAALFAQCMAIPECLDSYDQARSELLEILDVLDLSSTAQLLSEGLAPWIAADPRMPYTIEEVGIAVTETQGFIDQRRIELEETLPDWLSP